VEIFELIKGDLRRVERGYGARVGGIGGSHHRHWPLPADSGGKRLRPALLLLSARLFGPVNPGAVSLGAVVELIHTATLVHDDVIDDAETRRGRPSTNARWGNQICVLAGDWLYMQAFQIALRERNFRVLDLLIGLTQMMVEGNSFSSAPRSGGLRSGLHGTG